MPDMIHDCANYLHELAILALLLKIWCTQNCSGISAKTQFLYAMVYTTRYLDVYTVFISEQNTAMKILYLIVGYCTVLSMLLFFRKSYEQKHDTFRIEILIISCMVIALLVNHDLEPFELFWSFSIYLEAVAILPQFHFISNAKEMHKHVFYYILALGTYKCMYLIHWIYGYYERGVYDKLVVASGLVQFIIYCDFCFKVVPYIKPKKTELQQNTGDVNYTNSEKDGHLNGNISTIVLTPASLMSTKSDKVTLLKAEEVNTSSDH